MVQLFDRKRRKTGITGGWLGRFGGAHQTEEEICWEEWVVQVVVARPRTEAGELPLLRVYIVSNACIRPDQSTQSYGVFVAEGCYEDRVHCKQR